ncbi:unnamed protein product [Trichogramma brassicae]|uniref:Uncharacterized protein n=1 Tax=Trichogramma brassicae TaxID=86971 RepID=A0A6H5I391_9HYME|nr:unnamed protein product [Trichogramma brassicae]
MPGLPLIHRECGARVLSLPEVQRRKRETTLPAPRGHDAGKHHQAHAREEKLLRRAGILVLTRGLLRGRYRDGGTIRTSRRRCQSRHVHALGVAHRRPVPSQRNCENFIGSRAPTQTSWTTSSNRLLCTHSRGPVACIFVIPTLYFYSSRKPVDDIVDMLVMKKANIEARNSHGDSPLQYAVSRFNVDVAGALLKNSASLSSFKRRQNIQHDLHDIGIEELFFNFLHHRMMKLLKSADYQMNMNTRLRMLKYWMEIRGNDTDHLIPYNEAQSTAATFASSACTRKYCSSELFFVLLTPHSPLSHSSVTTYEV